MTDRQPNRLAAETSPYLLQHAHNPVDWFPWGPEALERSRREEKPIFLSVGYSACHWCHVMERESFEDESIAALLNEHFVCIKVDREERPDLDEIYMKAVQAMTGSGGWPMSVFLTPELEPFFGGTYFPPHQRWGRPGFSDVLRGLSRAWEKDRETIVRQGKRMAETIAREAGAQLTGELDRDVLERAFSALQQLHDGEWGGFGQAPKFPHSMDLRLALLHWKRTSDPFALDMLTVSLDRMLEGGIHDQLGGGFHRYSTDERWLIPHFEKMLYDNALLVPLYVEGYLATGYERWARVAREACGWMLREMRTPEGAFASTQDADSEGEEGRFFVWTPAELEEVLGRELGRQAAAYWGVTPEGNFEHGRSALWRNVPVAQVARELGLAEDELEARMREARERLFEARSQRPRPATDDKVLVSWNGLAISALARAWQALRGPGWLEAARAAARHALERMRRPDGRLLATFRGGRARLDAYLDDYAFLIQGLLDLWESDFDPRWLREALALERIVAERFEDPVRGGFYTTADDHERLIARLKSTHDGALPAGGSVHALNLLRLAELSGRRELAERAQSAIRSHALLVNRHPAAFTQLLAAVDHLASDPLEVVLSGEPGSQDLEALLGALRGTFRPQRVVALAHEGADEALVPLVAGKRSAKDGAVAYVCRAWSCSAPVRTPDELREALA